MLEKITVGMISTNCYIIRVGVDGAVVIDPGDDAPLIVKKLEELRLIPHYILFTHGHYDHLAGLPGLLAHYAALNIYPKTAIHQDDAYFLGQGAYKQHCCCFAAITGGYTTFVDKLWSSELPEPDVILQEGMVIEQFRIIHLPGHSAGSAAFYDEAGGLLISGDTLFQNGVGRTDMPGSNGGLLKKSLAKLFELPADTKVYPGHGSSTTIGQEKDLSLLGL
ncbi:MAG: MBL fold metallo-hydrolase [Spirochaetaceae bacterium]|jgi:glyoxylase-like metal-dependent hydrolase (beta-lactamase superfamily II)|nr:MBL fold metallo-hydrolase [Spirochaetaceae bacterium]